jgi:hypothetical protein
MAAVLVFIAVSGRNLCIGLKGSSDKEAVSVPWLKSETGNTDLIVIGRILLLAIMLLDLAAAFSSDMVTDSELKTEERSFFVKSLNATLVWPVLCLLSERNSDFC